MKYLSATRLTKWPFLIADAVLLAAAGILVAFAPSATAWWMLGLIVSVGLAAWLGVTPFLVEYKAEVKFAESNSLVGAVEQLQNLRTFTNQISFATAQWQVVQEQATGTVASARQLAERMSAEAKAFGEFMQKANDGERAVLLLQVYKLQRGQAEWLQVLISVMDHVYALYLAGCRSGQQSIVDQLGRFQNACREVIRKVGLVPFEVATEAAFDANVHQLLGGDAPTAADARISGTLAPGYSFQGQIIRNALVALKEEQPFAAAAPQFTAVQ